MRPPPPRPVVRARRWAQKNLFGSPANSLITLALGAATLWIVFRFIRWLVITAEWEPVQRNLTLFMMGNFPRSQQWRLIASVVLIGLAIGLAAGLLSRAARHRATAEGVAFEPVRAAEFLRRYWAVVALVAVLLLAARTPTPWLFTAAAVGAGVLGHAVCSRIPRAWIAPGWLVVALAGLASFQVLAGTGGNGWLGPAAVVAVPVWSLAARAAPGGSQSVALAIRLGATAAAVTGVRAIYSLDFVDFGSVPINQWAGFHLTLFVTAVTIVAAFPLGLVLAMGRRSSMPVMRWLSAAYVEFIRGVPLVTLLLVAQFFLGFFAEAAGNLDLLTRAIIVMTLFTAAYVAEIVRGGLEAVPKGQLEAGQAVGLPVGRLMGLIVIPQALRASIPALVGQFISLFKDTSLLSAIGIIEFLGVRESVHAQGAFRVGFEEITLVFVAFGYWAVAYTMSRESQRLEHRLGVGIR